jgi:hypothetical protein
MLKDGIAINLGKVLSSPTNQEGIIIITFGHVLEMVCDRTTTYIWLVLPLVFGGSKTINISVIG